MRFVSHISMAASLMVSCYAEEKSSKIYGTWISDREATSEYLLKHAKLDDYQKMVLPIIFGRMEVTYREDGTGTAILKAARIPKRGGGEIHLEQTSIDFTFEIVGESEFQVVTKLTSGNGIMASYPFSLTRFHDRDTTSAAFSDGITNTNGREFFKRVKNKEVDKPSP